MSLRVKLTIMFLLIALIPAIIVSTLTFENYKNSLERNRLSQLQNLVLYKTDLIEAYFEALKNNMETAQGFFNIQKNLPVLSRRSGNIDGPEFLAAKEMLDGQLRGMQAVLGLSDIMLAGPDGRVVYTSNPQHFSNEFLNPLPAPYSKAFTEGEKVLYFSDVFFSKAQGNKVNMLVTAPVLNTKGAIAGVIAFEVDMARIYSIIQDVTGLGDTGETLAGKKTGSDAVYLNPLRHDPQAALKRKVHLGKVEAYPIQEAVQGRTGAGRSIDYRGEDVIAAWSYVPLLDWGVVAKIDSREAFADVTKSRKLAMIIMAMIFILGSTIAFVMARSVSEPIKKLTKDAEIIGGGNLDHTVATDLRDEIGQLSRSFDKMTRDLKKITASRDELNREIDEREQAEETLRRTLKELQQRETEITALLEASRAVMEQHDFKETAKLIFDSCKKIIGATAGYVALLSNDGHENEVLFLDAGGIPCTVDPSLPMPVRGLRGVAYSTGRTVYENDFPRSEWVKFMPEGHAALHNVMFAPLLIGEATVGILGLANKKDGFGDNDARMASAFGELASIALQNSRLFELLKNNEEKFRSVVQTASDAIISADINGNIIFWNRSAETIFGFSAAEVMGKPLTFIVPERFREYHQTGMKRVLDRGMLTTTGKRLETTGVRKDGSEFPLELSLARWETGEGDFFTAIIRDITERKIAEAALLESEQRLNRSQEIAHLGSWELDLVKNRLFWSDEVYRIFGLQPQEFRATYEAFLEAVHPDDREAVDAAYTDSLRDGRDIYEIEHRVERRLTGEVRTVHEKCFHVRDDSGRIIRSIGMVHDITERKALEEERERLLNELMSSNRELEQFAYIASHDLQEPLRMVSSYVQLLSHRYKERLDEDADEFISYAVNGTAHMQALLNDLLTYSRVGRKGEPFKLTDLNSALDRAIINLKMVIDQARAEITYENLPVLFADEVQMVQVFQNLLSNAIKFNKAAIPRISISAEMRGDEWVIRIKDNGISIDPKYFDRIFDIFKRLYPRAKYEGTGIGLAICNKIIERHGGRIWVESTPGEGATFSFTIPVKK